MDATGITTGPTHEASAASPRLTLRSLARAARRILLGAVVGLAGLAVVAALADPYSPPGCPASAAAGRDCAGPGFLGRLYAANLQVRANAAATPQESLAYAKRAIAFRPNFAFAFNTMGIAYDDMGRPEEALKAYDRALAIAPAYIGARANRALLYQRIGRPEDAARDFGIVYASPSGSHRRAEVVDFALDVDRTAP